LTLKLIFTWVLFHRLLDTSPYWSVIYIMLWSIQCFNAVAGGIYILGYISAYISAFNASMLWQVVYILWDIPQLIYQDDPNMYIPSQHWMLCSKLFISRPHLSTFDLSYNNLSLIIPPKFKHPRALEKLDLKFNELWDSIPKALCKCTQLQQITLSENSWTETIWTKILCIFEL